MQAPKVIAEIGCNHKGDIEIAFEMIRVAAIFAKADAVKFQKRSNRELLTPEEYGRPHPNPIFAYGPTYGEHREFLEFDAAQHRELKACCDENRIEYSTSVWDPTSAREMAALEPRMLKVPSACNRNQALLTVLAEEYPGEIHVSLGMTTRREQDEIIEFFNARGRSRDLVIYACTSGYPVAFDDICLFDIQRLQERFGRRVKAVGFSGHHLGVAADVAAMTLGARYIERHFTLDRTWKGTDHAASLEPDGLRRLVRDCRNVSRALRPKVEGVIAVERPQREKLKATQLKWA